VRFGVYCVAKPGMIENARCRDAARVGALLCSRYYAGSRP